MRKRRAQGQQAAASGAFLWVFVYAFRTLFRRGLDNLSRLPADCGGKTLKQRGFYHPKCVDKRYLFCWYLASFLLTASSGYTPFLHCIIHISRLAFFELMKYNKKCCRRCEYGLHDTQRSKREMGRFIPSSQLLLRRWAYSRRCENGRCLADPKRGS